MRLLPIVDTTSERALSARVMAELLEGEASAEPGATCDNCAMVAAPQHIGSASFFESSVKCCTYYPRLANFQVGEILRDESTPERAKAHIRARIAAQVGVRPLGIDPLPSQSILYTSLKSGGFGRATSLRCPFYDTQRTDKNCQIWRSRNAICSTWYCKHERGAVGQRMWLGSRDLLKEIERTIALYCAMALGHVGRALAELDSWRVSEEELVAELTSPTVQMHEELQGDSLEISEDYFLACARQAEFLSTADVRSLGGVRLDARARSVRAMLLPADFSLDPRYTLVAMPLTTTPHRDDEVMIGTYSNYDPLIIPRPLVDALVCFDGRPVPTVLDEIGDRLALAIEPALIEKLVDFGVLKRVRLSGNGVSIQRRST
jgi:Fe-S-cluster containining protein